MTGPGGGGGGGKRIKFACGVARFRHSEEAGTFKKELTEAPLPLPRRIKFTWKLDGRAREGGGGGCQGSNSRHVSCVLLLGNTNMQGSLPAKMEIKPTLTSTCTWLGWGWTFRSPLQAASRAKQGFPAPEPPLLQSPLCSCPELKPQGVQPTLTWTWLGSGMDIRNPSTSSSKGTGGPPPCPPCSCPELEPCAGRPWGLKCGLETGVGVTRRRPKRGQRMVVLSTAAYNQTWHRQQ